MEITEQKAMTVGDWIITMIILAIPLVNIIMLFVWGFGAETQPSKKSYAQASLIIFGVVIILGIVFSILAAVFGVAMSHNIQTNN